MVMSLDVFPVVSVNDQRDRREAHRVVLRDGSLRDTAGRVPSTDGANVILGQFRRSGAFTSPMAVFPDGVVNIVRARAQKQVQRVHAWWVVAVMEHAFPWGDRSKCEFPRNAMRELAPDGIDEAIPAVVGAGCPCPTASRFSLPNLRPEPFRDRQARIAVLPTAQMGTAPLPSLRSGERGATVFAYARRMWASHVTSLGSLVRGASGAETPARSAYLTSPLPCPTVARQAVL